MNNCSIKILATATSDSLASFLEMTLIEKISETNELENIIVGYKK